MAPAIFFGADYEAHAAELRTPTDFVRRFGRREPLFPSGSRWGYSNFGFILLGAIIERASGQSWDALLTERVFRVAGMTATSATASPGDTATPLNGAARTGLKPLPFYVGTPAGGGYSTVGDLHQFTHALRSGLLLDVQHLRLMTEPAVIAGSAHWSFGLRIATRNGATRIGHRGSARGPMPISVSIHDRAMACSSSPIAATPMRPTSPNSAAPGCRSRNPLWRMLAMRASTRHYASRRETCRAR